MAYPNEQRKYIPINGIVRDKSDLLNKDGDCEEVINLRFKNGAWRPSYAKVQLSGYQHNCRNLYYHPAAGSSYSKFVGYSPSDDKIKRINTSTDSLTDLVTLDGTETFKNFAHLNDILVVTTDRNKYFFSWNGSSYDELETTDIFPDLEFYMGTANGVSQGVGEQLSSLEDAVTALQSRIADANKDGYFCEQTVAFQWVFELFDGSEIRHSNPYLVDVGSYASDTVLGTEIRLAKSGDPYYYFEYLVAAPIKYRFKLSDEKLTSLKKYSGLINNIRIYMTREVSNWVWDTEIANYLSLSSGATDYYSPPSNKASLSRVGEAHPYFLVKKLSFDEFANDSGWAAGLSTERTLDPNKANSTMNHNGFINGDETDVGFSALENSPAIEIDSFTHHQQLGYQVYNYNSRIHNGYVKTKLGDPHNISSWYHASQAGSGYSLQDVEDQNNSYRLEVTIETEFGTKYVLEDWNPHIMEKAASDDKIVVLPVISYPDSRATRIRILGSDKSDWNDDVYEVANYELTPHTFKNLAYCIVNATDNSAGGTNNRYFLDFDVLTVPNDLSSEYSTVADMATDDRYYIDENRVQLSHLNNPFYYPADNSYQIGNEEAEITGFASQSTPQSEGQFGEYPMHVFTKTGIYVMLQGSGDVQYSNILKLNNDRMLGSCKEDLGGAIAYGCVEGLVILEGNKRNVISKLIDAESTNPLISDTDYQGFVEDDGSTPTQVDLMDYITAKGDGIRDFIDENAILAFDPSVNELILSNSAEDYSYVFSFDTGTWHKITDGYDGFIDIYPYRAGYLNNQYIDYLYDSGVVSPENTEVLIQTKPFSLESNGYKHILRLIENSWLDIDTTDRTGGLYIYASNDLKNWDLIRGAEHEGDDAQYIHRQMLEGLHGSFRYFIIVSVGYVKEAEYTGYEVGYIPKEQSKIR